MQNCSLIMTFRKEWEAKDVSFLGERGLFLLYFSLEMFNENASRKLPCIILEVSFKKKSQGFLQLSYKNTGEIFEVEYYLPLQPSGNIHSSPANSTAKVLLKNHKLKTKGKKIG